MKPPPRPTVVTPSPASFAPLIEERHLDPSARVYVNRNLRLASIGAIGFDLDHTLAYYDPIPIERLAFRLTQQKLVEKRGYPSRILDIEYDPEFVIRGLVIDRRRGNILKMDYHSYVSKAFHGRELLLSDERKSIYRRQRVRLSYDSFVSVDTFFHLPEVYLYVALVDDAEKNSGKKKMGRADYHKLYADVREMIDEAHADRSIKSEIMSRPQEFLRDDPHVAATLDEFRRAGKKLFLLTNSEMYYTDALLTHLFRHGNGHSNWREYFDLIIVQSRKPEFFLNRGGAEAAAAESVADPGPTNGPPTFSGGDAQFLEKALGFRGDQIVYFGDHTYGDILRSKKSLGWRTAMIVPELDDEIETTLRLDGDLKRLRALALRRENLVYRKTALQRELRARLVTRQRERPADGITPETETMEKRFMDAESELQKLDAEIAVLEVSCDTAYNPHWGPLFREGNEMSRFAHQVRDFACLYTSRVSNFLNYPMDHYFQSPGSFMPHELR